MNRVIGKKASMTYANSNGANIFHIVCSLEQFIVNLLHAFATDW